MRSPVCATHTHVSCQSFFDKICGIQRNGKRYRGNLVPLLIQKYGIEVGSPEDGIEFDQIQSFRRFLLFARDTIRWRRPMDPDIHWSAMSGHVSTFVISGGRYDNIFWTEQFNDGMQSVLDAIETQMQSISTRSHALTKAKDTGQNVRTRSRIISTICRCILSMRSTKRISGCSNMILKIPANKMPIGEIDLDEVHAKLGE